MRVLVAAVLFSREQSGVQSHGFGLVRSLLTRREVSSITLVIGRWQRALVEAAPFMDDPRVRLCVVDAGPGAFERNRWYYAELPLLAHELRIDVVHLTCPAPVKAGGFRCPVVVTLHDLYPYQIPSNFGLVKGVLNRHLLQRCLVNASAIACVSDATLQVLRQYVSKGVRERALRIYNCVEAFGGSGSTAGVEPLLQQPFILCVAQHRANKNIPFLLQCFAGLLRGGGLDPSTRLAIVGIEGPETRRIAGTLEALGLEENVVLLHGLSDADMSWCYRNCFTVAAPSLVEGFGMPVVEALQAGCKVVCSDIPAFREVGSEHCLYVPLDGEAEAAFSQGILQVIEQPAQAPRAMPWLSRAVIAEEYLHLYRQLLDSGSPAEKFSLPAWLYRDSLGEIAERGTL